MTNVTRAGAELVFAFITPAGRPVPVDVELAYRAEDPHAVSMTFRMAEQETTWLVSRDLLADGLITRSGGGDVRLRPYTSEMAVLELCSDNGHAVFHVRSSELQAFLNSTYDVVAPGRESDHFDFDAELRRLLAQ
ncbi:SsgA family sporulation/cell division regulator [Lentzea sp. NBRC 105346]|uniref:SsgA family sporulation/cell division regulator n=1 Tax=Lentzea sp. NBRC 105346 TaxID=3032205 RepID=UPI002554A6F6|nr:SsgA family sporulation/cell division regulator [Lentzea sp. NBRC 105346]